ncbi:MAG TPA: M15 family metallopeptidase [Kofleriaceae bacterium]|nr:M15 family metallopeptidase [Kofleriaceae bacterium]
MAIAYRYDEDDDKQLRDAPAPLADHGESAGGTRVPGGYAGQSLAEISAQYDSAGDTAAASGPDLDQLSLHGAAPEPSHVDPVATAVAQTELERPAAAAHDHAQDAEAGDAEGPQAGAIQHAPGGATQATHDVPSPSALSGAAQGLQVVAAAAPGPGAAQGRKPPLSQAELHEMLEDSPAPAAAAPRNAHPLSQAELHEFLDDPAPAAAPRPPAHPLTQAEMHEMLEDSPAPAATATRNTHPLSQAELHELLDDPAPAAAPKAPAAAPPGNAHPLSQAELHEFLDDPAPAAAPKAPAAAPKGPAAATSWQAAARTYNERHGLVAQFNAATGNVCGSGGDADPEAIAAWQRAHGIPADGRIGPVTLGAATQVAAAPAKADAPAPAAAPRPAVAPTPAAAPAVTPAPQAVKPVPVAAPAPAVTAAPQAVKPVPVAAPAPAVTPAPPVARPAIAAPVKPAEAPAVAAPRPAAAAPATANSFTGTDDLKKPGKDRWTSYGKGDNKTYGWDLGGTHGVKNPGGDAGNAIYAVSNVEGRYDSVQTYDAGILSFGIMQWTLHAGSLQKFLGFLKDKSGPDGRAAFQDDFVAKGIDVKPSGGQYQLSYNGKEYALGADGEGKDAIDKLVRQDKDTARKWSEIFAAAGADPRVQKAEFERAKEMYQETQGIRFTDKVVDQSLKACKNTFHARYRDQYGKAEAWTTASPKAGALFFSMRVNNPKYANAAFLKAIDAFYDGHGTDRAKWPASWGDDFGNLVEAKCKETLDNWHSEGDNEGRVEKTLRFWNKAQGQTAAPATTAAAPAARPAVPQAAAAQPAGDGKLDAARQQKLRAQYAAIMKQFVRGKIDQGEAVKSLIAYDEKLNGGKPSVEGLVLLPVLLADLVKVMLARNAAPTPAPAPKPSAQVAHDVAAPSKPADKVAAPTPVPDAGRRTAPTPAAEVTPAAEHIDSHVVTVGSGEDAQKVLVYVSPGKLTPTPNIFMFLHGFDADYGIDAAQKGKDPNAVISGADVAQEAMSRARDKNTIAVLPQGVSGRAPKRKDRSDEGGYMKGLQGADSLPAFLAGTLRALTEQIGGGPLAPGHISIAGHSAGGYQGVHSALEGAGKLADAITDVTLMDSDYAPGHYESTQKWMLKGSPGKTVRIIETPTQLHTAGKSYWKKYFDRGVLEGMAGKLGYSIERGPEGEKRGPYMSVFQHTRLMKDGANHCDVLILAYDKSHNELKDHHPLRDEVMDDSVLSVGEGAAGNDTYGKRDHGVLREGPAAQAPAADGHRDNQVRAAEADAKHTEAEAAAETKHDPTPKEDADHKPDQKSGGKPRAFLPATRDVYKDGGKLSKQKLTQFNLSDEEYKFKQRVYDKVTGRLGDHIYGGVAKGDLAPCDNGHEIRKDVLPHLDSLLSGLRAAITAKQVAHGPDGDIAIGNVTGIQVQSGYRSPEYDMTLWDGQFQATFKETEKARAATGDPLGDKAVEEFIEVYKWRKAPPGGSNHSNGNAVDLTVLTSNGAIPNHFTDQKAWHKSWAYFWLKEHAATYGFKNYIKEAWHWEWWG